MNKKVILAVLMAVCLLFTLCACAPENNDGDADVTTTTTTTTATAGTTGTTLPEGTVKYTVTVVDETGAPLVGVMMQICKESCLPAMTDANGVATWTVAEDDYKVSFADTSISETYEVEENYYFEDGKYEMTITVTTIGESSFNDAEFAW